MKTETITVHVTPQVATAYRSVSEEDRRKLDLLVNLQLNEFLKSGESLDKVMEDMSREAAATAFTPEMLDAIIHGT